MFRCVIHFWCIMAMTDDVTSSNNSIDWQNHFFYRNDLSELQVYIYAAEFPITLKPEEFSSYPSITDVCIKETRVNVKTGAFEGIKSLQKLSLVNCGLKNTPDMDTVKDTLRELDLSKNSLSHLDLRGFKSLVRVKLENGKLRNLPDISNSEIDFSDLSFENNGISSVSKDYFMNFTQLKFLNLKNNKLTQVPDISYVAHSLSALNFAGNKISSCVGICNNYFPELNKIDLSNNQLQKIHLLFALPGWPKLVVLDISNNNITGLENLHSTTLPNDDNVAKGLMMNNNPLWCDQSLIWLIRGVQDSRDFDIQFGQVILYGAHTLVCHGPPELANTLISDVDLNAIGLTSGLKVAVMSGYLHLVMIGILNID